MDPRLQRRVQRYGWDKASEHYEASWKRQLEPAQTLLLELAQPQPGERVLDVACGTGLLTWPTAERVGNAGRVLGTDLSDAMVDSCRSEARARGLANVDFARMDAEAMDLPDEPFDAVLCGLGLMYCPNPVAALGEMQRALRPGGRLAVAVWGARENCGWAEIFPIVDHRVKTEVCPLFFQLGSGNALRVSIEAAGFESVQIARIESVLEYASADEAVQAAFVGGPVAMAYSRFDEETRNQAHAEYLESIARFESNDRYTIPGEFVVASARRGSSSS